MTVEAADFVGELDDTLPTDNNDFVFEGDDHFRLIKSTLINSFAAILGAVTVNQDELNSLTGITGVVQTRLNALEADSIPAGTVMVFVQPAAPVGWTFSAVHNDKVFINSATEADGGVDVAGSTWTISGLSAGDVGGTAISTAQMPPHDHPYTDATQGGGLKLSFGGPGDADIKGDPTVNGRATGSKGGGATHTHTGSIISQDGNWRPLAVNVITCIKD